MYWSSKNLETLCQAMELHHWKVEEQWRLDKVRLAEEEALAIAEKEKAKCMEAIDKAEVAPRMAELEARKRINAETKAFKEVDEKKKVLDKLAQTGVKYNKYAVREIGRLKQ